jgi:molecular chaperone DnaK
MMSKVIGIDLGTTNSVLAILENEEPYVVTNKLGERLTPSVVGLGKNKEILVGRIAKNQSVINNDNTVLSVKRKMGSSEKLKLGDKDFTPQEISAHILSKIKNDAEEYLGEPVFDAVITVPAYFDDNQRQATKDAGRIAGLNVLRIINEPTAAALAYGIGKNEERTVLVYDLGGGTFDVSILDIADGVFQVLATAGNNMLGGDDFDNALIELIFSQFNSREGIDLRADKMACQKLREEVEKAKIALSELSEIEINIPFISADEKGAKHLNITITKDQFEDLISEYIDETLALTQKALSDAGLGVKDIDKVILVGGSTRVPYVVKRVRELLNINIESGINPDEVVAIGAAIQAGIVRGEKKGIVLVDVTPLSLGIEIEGGIFVPVIDRNTTIPVGAKKLFTTISDNQRIVEIHILQGERTKAGENISLGKFQLSGIRKAPKGEPRIEVEFNIDVDGIVNVQAIDLDTGASQEVKIENSSQLSEEEIERIISDAKQKKEEDKLHFELKTRRENLIKLSGSLSVLADENQESIPETLVKEVKKLIKHVESKYSKYSISETDEALERLEFYDNEIKSEIDKS